MLIPKPVPPGLTEHPFGSNVLTRRSSRSLIPRPLSLTSTFTPFPHGSAVTETFPGRKVRGPVMNAS